MHWFGWKWSADTKWNAVLLWGAVASDGVHGPRARAFWRYIVSDCRYDWTRGFSLFLSLHLCSFYLFFVLFLCSICQVVTVLHLQNEGYITLRDVKGSKLSGNVFNILFNLNKFIAFETRDPFLIRQVEISLRSYIVDMKALVMLVTSNNEFCLGTWGSKFDRVGSFCT